MFFQNKNQQWIYQENISMCYMLYDIFILFSILNAALSLQILFKFTPIKT